MRASAPGKILIAGEYAVLEGSAAIVMAVDRRARAWARSSDGAAPRSPFLVAAAAALAAELGADSAAARAAARVRVDTSALCAPSGAKLGLGSSAAATVAALAACLGAPDAAFETHRRAPTDPTPTDRAPLDRALLHGLAHRAHAAAQARIGETAGAESRSHVRGSGADIAASVWGGVLHLEPALGSDEPPRVSPLRLPAGLELVPVWTARPADTRALVAAISALSAADPAAYRAHLAVIADAAAALIAACRADRADGAVEAFAAAGSAVAELGAAAQVDLYLDVHRALAERAIAHGGALKPTGAGGGDIALAAFAEAGGAEEFRTHVASLGMAVLDLRVEWLGASQER